jgi:phosphoribosyl 1,2-cyclic phosphate phosphodiesterase
MNMEQALSAAERIGARRTLFVHMSHDLGHEATNRELPADKQLAFDGQVVE